MDLKVEIIARETIKPSSPTPNHFKIFKLSLLDQFMPDVYTPIILFYNSIDKSSNEISQLLKESLRQTLCHFYPFAGRINNNISIECNDEGAYFFEAQVNCYLSDFLSQPKIESLHNFLPVDVLSKEAIRKCLLLVQANFFECGGLAIGLCLSHKITDAATLSTFIRGWSTISLDPKNTMVEPKFIASSLFQPIDRVILPEFGLVRERTSTRRYLFDALKIAQLKDKVASAIVPQPTRVEAVTSLIWKCAIKASRLASGLKRPSVLVQAVNLRKRVSPPLPESTIGNLISSILVRTRESNHETELSGFVCEMRNALQEFSDKFKTRLEGEEAASLCMELTKEVRRELNDDGIEFYMSTSRCKFPFYEANFGWGKPTWVCRPSTNPKNVILLMDTKDDGIEAWVTLSEENMALFEHEQELLSFASLNPSILI